jgi:ergothioneine biosynthesis protein EgtB
MNRSELEKYFIFVREASEKICQPLEIEDYVVQPIEDVSPPKWHLGHTSWFYEAMFLDKYLTDYRPYHPIYSFLFNSYYHSLGDRWDRPRRGVLSRPSVSDVYKYRKEITQRMIDLIHAVPDEKWSDFKNLLILGLNHEQQHQELLVTDIKYILSSNPLYPAYRNGAKTGAYSGQVSPNYVSFDGNVYDIGYNDGGFCYDNEQPHHQTFLAPFRIMDRLVTNSEYLEFIEDGGYRNFEYWLSDGWDCIQNNGWQAPLNWIKLDDEWHEITLMGLQKLEHAAPVCHVSYYETEAYASWAKKRLPTEAEWEVAARLTHGEDKSGNFWEDQLLHPQVADKNGKFPVKQMLGDVWEWTSSSYLPYPGYKQMEGALGEYNGKFMINQMILRGGSCATARDHIRPTYRNFFQPDKRWQFSGFRLAE